MPKLAWVFVGIFSAAILIGCFWFSAHQKHLALEKHQADLAAVSAALEKSSAEVEGLQRRLKDNQARVDDLQREKEAVTQAQQGLESQMRSALESKDITISELQGKLTVNILDRILFDSGEAVLKPEGEKVLEKVAAILAQYPKRQVHVLGHTDNVPIRASARSRFASNWELSTARATAAVRFLCERGGVDPRRLGALGYGEFRPLADNATSEGRAQNRRIALVIMSDELAGLDLGPAAKPLIVPSPTPAPPPLDDAPIPATPGTNTPAAPAEKPPPQ